MAATHRGHYDAVVIGSGFGGAVAAYHLVAERDLKVLLLERGLPYPPGSFARTPREMSRNFWDPSAGLHGLFEMWSFSHVRALVSSGLGGGSLIYANVLLPKPPDSFAADPSNDGVAWPVTAADLAAEYAGVARVLEPTPLPDEYFEPPRERGGVTKTQRFFAAARAGGLEPARAPIAVTFRAPGAGGAGVAAAAGGAAAGGAAAGGGAARAEPGVPFGAANLHGRPRHTCTLVGECDLGCNEGAKNTLDYTYLTDFLATGGDRAQIFTCCEATGIEPADGGGYQVHFVEHRAARAQVLGRRQPEDGAAELLDPATDEASDAWTRTVTASVVVVAGGTFGSTRLLLASRPRLPRLSAQLGRRFSTNGDLLTVARGCRAPDGSADDLDPTYGPVITAYAEHATNGRRLWMQDAGGPGVSAWAWQAGEMPRDLWSARELLPGLIRGRRGGRISALMARALGSAESSASMLPMLTMGEDVSGGRMRLEGDGLALDWDPRGASRSYFRSALGLAELLAKGLGGRLGPPLAARLAPGLTAHPLGGCPMGTDARNGVVDSHGEVFGYPGLFVADGSIMPGPVGPNPSFTIAAMASRIGQAARERAS
ncbi:MAG TPA: GMC oxidoreductase [Solirubrobacteraceae bacterium]|nr:GMC oxidoreductase [Solirubrobacteraceae bacterium]